MGGFLTFFVPTANVQANLSPVPFGAPYKTITGGLNVTVEWDKPILYPTGYTKSNFRVKQDGTPVTIFEAAASSSTSSLIITTGVTNPPEEITIELLNYDANLKGTNGYAVQPFGPLICQSP